MKNKHLLIFLASVLVEGIFSLIYLFLLNFEPARGHIFNYSALKQVLLIIIFIVLVALLVLVIALGRGINWGQGFLVYLDTHLVGPKKRLFIIQWFLLVLALFMLECFLMTYLAFPEPARPLFMWATLSCLDAWLILRYAYAGIYRQQASLLARLRAKWAEKLPVQQKTFIVLAILAIVYFAAFIPGNLLRDRNGNFFVHADEQVLYPDVTQGMVFEGTISSMVHVVMEHWPWQYGYPYFTLSAVVLLIPRLIFGDQFATHVQLNIFLLRQFINVAPMTLTILLVVYLVTKYKSMLISVGLFIFLALIPGIVKFNLKFWHADGVVVFLVMLTIYLLQKDRLRFGRFFLLAALSCGLAAATKLWGLFFGPVIAGYLLAGFINKQLTFGKMLLKGSVFLLAMLATIIISSPTLMAPYIARVALRGWLPMQGSLLGGYGYDATGEYDLGLLNWLKYFGFHYMKGYFFFFSFIALITGSFWGSRRRLNRILLGWCAVTAFFLAYFVALKNFQYMLPLAVPLYCGAFLFPAVSSGNAGSKMGAFLSKPLTRRVIMWVTGLMLTSQFTINLVILGLFAVRGR